MQDESFIAQLSTATQPVEINEYLNLQHQLYDDRGWNPVKYIWLQTTIDNFYVLIRYTIYYDEYIDEIKVYVGTENQPTAAWTVKMYCENKETHIVGTDYMRFVHGHYAYSDDDGITIYLNAEHNIKLTIHGYGVGVADDYLPFKMMYPIGLQPNCVRPNNTELTLSLGSVLTPVFIDTLYNVISVHLNALAITGYWCYASRNLVNNHYDLTDDIDIARSITRCITDITSGELNVGTYIIKNNTAIIQPYVPREFINDIKRLGDLH